MKYRYATWCRYCMRDIDSACGDDYWEDEELFDTPEQADAAAREYTGDTCYDYAVIDENGATVEESEVTQ